MTVKNIHGLQAIDSREVAEMVGKQHKHHQKGLRHDCQQTHR